MCILFYPKFPEGKTCKRMHVRGTHAFPRVTSVNPGACKYNSQDEPWEGDLRHSTRPSEREPVGPLQEYFVQSRNRNRNRETIP
jgi:hypothetical protein